MEFARYATLTVSQLITFSSAACSNWNLEKYQASHIEDDDVNSVIAGWLDFGRGINDVFVNGLMLMRCAWKINANGSLNMSHF